MAVVLLDSASLDKSASAESENSSGSGTTNSTGDSSSGSESSDSSSSGLASGLSSDSSGISSNGSSSKESVTSAAVRQALDSPVTKESDAGGSKTSKASFNLLNTIKRSSNKLNKEFRKRVNNNEYPSSTGSNASFTSRSSKTAYTAITQSLSASSEELSEAMSKTLAMFTGPQKEFGTTVESVPNGLDSANSDLDEDDGYDWTAVAIPKGFISTVSSQLSGVDSCDKSQDSSLHSLSSDSSCGTCSLDGEEDESREISLLDGSDSGDEEDDDGSGTENDSDIDSLQTFDSMFLDDYTEMDALKTLGGVVYQLGSCNFQGLRADFGDDESVTYEASPPPKEVNLSKEGGPSKNFFEKSKYYLGLGGEEEASSSQTFFESMFSCGA